MEVHASTEVDVHLYSYPGLSQLLGLASVAFSVEVGD
jgi:hypothetical protein